jgi:hypothetical protein
VADEHEVDHVVVRVSPDLKGFRAKLDADLAASTKKLPEVLIKLRADRSEFGTSIKDKVAEQQALRRQPTFSVELRASRSGFIKSVRAELVKQEAIANNPTFKVQLRADRRGFAASVRAVLKGVKPVAGGAGGGGGGRGGGGLGGALDDGDDEGKAVAKLKRIEGSVLQYADRVSYQLAAKLHEQFLIPFDADPIRNGMQRVQRRQAAIERAEQDAANARFNRVRTTEERNTRRLIVDEERARDEHYKREMARFTGHTEYMDHLRELALVDDERRTERNNRRREAEERRFSRESERIERDRQKRISALRSKVTAERYGPRIIDLGGQGIRPMNALYGVITAMSPALVAMGSSAIQASTSVAALGAAGIGAATGLSTLFGAFTNVFAAMKQANTTRLQGLRKQANATAGGGTDAADTRQLRDAEQALAQAQLQSVREQLDLNDAREQSRRDLRDLILQVRALRNEESGAALDLARARQEQGATNRNFFASALDRAEATQKVRDAEQKLADVHNERIDKTRQLHKLRANPDSDPQVRHALQAVADSQTAIRDATERLTDARTQQATATDKLTQADATLMDLRARMSKQGREFFDFLNGPYTDALWAFQKRMEAATLPGFLTFLKDAGAGSTEGAGALGIMADSAENMGKTMSRAAARAGKITKTGWFRGDLRKINKENEDSFDNLSDAALTLVKPLMRIMAAAAPLNTRFTKWLLNLTERFSDFIEKANDSGKLTKWFNDAGDALARWGELGHQIIRLIMPIFTQSLPAGNNLVDRLTAFIKQGADWTNSRKGMEAIGNFFDRVKNLPFGRIAEFLGQMTLAIGAVKTVRMAANHPFVTLFTVLASIDPAATATMLSQLTDVITGALDWVNKNPEAAKFWLTVFAGLAAGNKAIKFAMNIPGIGALQKTLTSKFAFMEKIFGGASSTGTMTVHAGVVNILGGAGLGTPGTPGAPGRGTPAPGAPAGRSGGRAFAGNLALMAGTTLGAYFASTIETDGMSSFKKGMVSALQGALSGAALGSMFGPVGAAAGAVIGATAGAYLQRRAELATATGGERYALENVQGDIARYGPTGQPVNDPAVARRRFVQDYITARRKSVDAAFEETKALKGTAAAEKVRYTETQKSVTVLSGLLQQYGWTKDKADAYSRAVYDLNGLTEKQRLANLNAQAALDDTKKKLKETGKATTDTAAEAKILASRLDELDGERTITVTLNGKPAVFRDLETALVYQRLLSTGQDYTQGNIAKQRAALQKQSMRLASGGKVAGFSPNPRADNIPALLTADEYVQPVDSVRYYGVGFMEALRARRIPREVFGYADGGLAGSRTWPFKVDISKTVVPDGGMGLLPAGVGKISGSERVAEIAEATARAMGASVKQLIALMSAGLVESGMRNLNYGDRDSVGFLQQRPSQGWGSIKQLMDPAYATRKFIQAAKHIRDRGMTPGQLAQAVQRSAYPGRYPLREPDAVAILNRNAPYVGVEPGATGAGGGGTRAALIAFGRWLQARGYDVSENPAFGGVHGGHVKGSQHYRGNAIDVNHGAGTSAREQAYLRAILPEARRRGLRAIFMSRGHYDHAHFDLGAGHALGGLVRSQKYDTGGWLPPGATLAVNNTGKPERVMTAEQAAGGGSMRIDRRDLAQLAAMISGAVNGQPITMDGRKVAEITNRYNYLPAGV